MLCSLVFFFFNDTATTEIYTLSLHDALPIYDPEFQDVLGEYGGRYAEQPAKIDPAWEKPDFARLVEEAFREGDRKSTRLNSSHANISYAVFCLKKKNNKSNRMNTRKNSSVDK